MRLIKSQCTVKSCTSGMPGLYEPVILLWPVGITNKKGFQPASLTVEQHVCAACKNAAKPTNFLNSDLWVKIQKHFFAVTKSLPSLQTAEVTFMLNDSFDNKGETA